MKSSPPIPVRLASRCSEALDIDAFEFVAADGGELPPFEAGAHIELTLPGGLLRPYSLCNDPAERHRYVLGVLREPASRGGSKALHEQVKVGDVLVAAPPRNLFQLATQARRSVLLAGGIGITPLLTMAETLARTGQPFELHYATRSSERCAFKQRLAAAGWASQARLYHDDAPAHARFDAAAVLGDPQPGVHAYVCGPAGFIDHVLAVAKRLGWPDEQIHSESFSPLAVLHGSANRPFEIELASTGRVLQVPADRTAVSVLAEHGVAPPTSCEQGICGTCVTTVLAGEPDHRDRYLTDADRARGDCFTPCCSRALGERLVLDL